MRSSRRERPAGAGDRRSTGERPHFSPRFFVDQEPPFPAGEHGEGDGALEAESALGLAPPLGASFTLVAEDSYHALRVLRVRAGDPCEVVSPAGHVYAGTVSAAADPVRVTLVARLEGDAAGAVYRAQVGVVQALARPAVMDYLIEKGTEVGASFFLLVPAVGSPRMPEDARADRLARWRRIAREAAKQSKQTAVPWVETAGSVADGLSRMAGSGTVLVILEPGARGSLPDVVRAALAGRGPSGRELGAQPPVSVSLWVGPEGGWTEAETDLLQAGGGVLARLGQSVLRAETAGPVAVALARSGLGDW